MKRRNFLGFLAASPFMAKPLEALAALRKRQPPDIAALGLAIDGDTIVSTELPFNGYKRLDWDQQAVHPSGVLVGGAIMIPVARATKRPPGIFIVECPLCGRQHAHMNTGHAVPRCAPDSISHDEYEFGYWIKTDSWKEATRSSRFPSVPPVGTEKEPGTPSCLQSRS